MNASDRIFNFQDIDLLYSLQWRGFKGIIYKYQCKYMCNGAKNQISNFSKQENRSKHIIYKVSYN